MINESVLFVLESMASYHYVGNCVDSFDEDTGDSLIPYFRDVSDFALKEEEGEKIEKSEFVKLTGGYKLPKHKFEYKRLSDVLITAYDVDTDIHWFFAAK